MDTKSVIKRWGIIFSLVFAGEMIFSLPFHLPRFYRATYLPVFDISNTQLGDAVAIYGIIAILAYFPGGVLADRFSARKLMSFSLIATALGGFYLITIPGVTGLAIVYGFWGITTILLFWAGMIKATRDWGGHLSQGKAFGILEAGRGLIAAGAASLGVIILSVFLPESLSNIANSERISAFKSVILMYTLLTILAAILIWFLIPEVKKNSQQKQANYFTGVFEVLKSKAIWLQALIVVCAYFGYKAIDFYTLYGTDVLGMNEVEASWFVSGSAYIRVVAAIMAGLLADRFSGTRVVVFLFAALVLSYVMLGFISPQNQSLWLIYANLIITISAVYAMRGVYFTLMEETRVKNHLTGTAVGLISLIGFTPDAFFYSLAGRIIDANPGLVGFQNFFLSLGIFSFAGIIAILLVNSQKKKMTKISDK